jgi:hypothetical protein
VSSRKTSEEVSVRGGAGGRSAHGAPSMRRIPRRPSSCTGCGAILPDVRPLPGGQISLTCSQCGLGRVSQALRPVPARTDAVLSLEERRALARRALQERTFPIYGLDATWHGGRWFAGSGRTDGVVDRIELGHGDVWDDSVPLVRVETVKDRNGPGNGYRFAARRLAQQLWHRGADHELVRSTFLSAEPTAAWDNTLLSVGTRPVPFRSLMAEPWWVALAHVNDQLVAVLSRHTTAVDVRLVAVEEVQPYLSFDAGPR